MGVEDARQLEERGISHGVVSDAYVPAVVVTVHQEELVGFARNRDHRQLAAVPAFVQGGTYGYGN